MAVMVRGVRIVNKHRAMKQKAEERINPEPEKDTGYHHFSVFALLPLFAFEPQVFPVIARILHADNLPQANRILTSKEENPHYCVGQT